MRFDGTTDQPAVADVLAAVYRFDPPTPLRAVIHLATPVDVVLGMHVRVHEGRLRWRGETADVPAGDLSGAVAAVTHLVARARVGGDRFLDLGADPGDWLKPLRSGADVHLFGVSEVFGRGHVTVDPALGGAVVDAVRRMVADGTLRSGPREIAGTPVVVDATGPFARVRAA